MYNYKKMLIDKSHSKKDIVKLFKIHGVNIDERLSKSNITKDIERYLNLCKFNGTMKNKNITEVKTYLKTKSPKQRPTAEKKIDIMFKAKKIIKWANNNYIFNGLTYTDYEEPYEDIMDIYKWGDLSSVRRACKFYNLCPHVKNHVNPVITDEVRKELNNNNIIKQQYVYNLTIRRATEDNKIIVNFD